METLGKAASRISASAGSAGTSARAVVSTGPSRTKNLPEMYVPEVDKVLPNSIWCGWRIDGKTRRIRRPLTEAERGMLERRAAELDPVMQPLSRPADDDRVAEAIADMFAAFPTMRATDEQALAKIDSLTLSVAEFPLWAIIEACDRIRTKGYEAVDRDGKIRIERHWPPSDAEVVDEVRRTVNLRAEALASAQALLAAEVDR